MRTDRIRGDSSLNKYGPEKKEEIEQKVSKYLGLVHLMDGNPVGTGVSVEEVTLLLNVDGELIEAHHINRRKK